ncbi:MAG: 2-oxo acid dehydrogenase subunit E2 [Planctomycetota bacterium]
MSKALERRPVKPSEITLINQQYLSQPTRADPTMVWGADVDAEEMCRRIARLNESSGPLISVAHVLIQAVARGLARFPQINCRIVRGRIFRFREVNVRMINYNPRAADVDILTIRQADRLSLEDIAQNLWSNQLAIAAGRHRDGGDKSWLNWGPSITRRWGSRLFWWLDRNLRLPRLGRIDSHLDSAVVVNYLGFPGAPSMKTYKPSKFPDESSLLSVTMGRIDQRPAVSGGQIVARRMAPLFVRADHRITDAYTLGRFVAAVGDALAVPQTMETRSGNASHARHAA